MAANPDRLEQMRRAKLRKVEALRRRLAQGLKNLVPDWPSASGRRPR